jgi:hypothetical protein
MSLQRTPVSGAIVKQVLHFATFEYSAIIAGQYALPPIVSPYAGATIQGEPANILSLPAYAVRMQNDGAVVSITAKNRVPIGTPADVIAYQVAKLRADTDFTSVLTPIPAGGSVFLGTSLVGPDSLKVLLANSSTLAVKSSIAINDAARGGFLAGDYLLLVGTIPFGGLATNPSAVDVEVEFFETR